ncbi:MAG: arylsulfatase [Planctomycetota bacterium]
MKMTDRFSSVKLVATAMTILALAEPALPAGRPNIVVVLVDDMGFSDLGCYGGEIETPHIDALAARGVRFSQFYNAARCCPTRATLMTGLYPHQVGIGHMTTAPEKKQRQPGPYQGYLNRNCVTLAEVLGAAGYQTLLAGKWHLGQHERSSWPLQRGFDKFYGCLAGSVNYFSPRAQRGITHGNEIDDQLASTTNRRYYTTDAFTDYAIRFISESLDAAQNPFFLYLSYNAPHWPLHAHEEDLAKYRGRYRIGWDELRHQRYQRQIELGLIPSHWPLSTRDSRVPAWDSLDNAKQDEMDMRMALYAAMVDRLDTNIGRLVDFLRSQDQLDNTLLVFLSDNGASAEGGILGREEVMDIEKRNASRTVSYGTAWANLSSTPYRLYKRYTHEGGACTPFFVHWPAKISSRSEWYREPAQLIDIVPTVLEVAGADYPETFQGNTILPLEGVSLAPAFKGQPLERSRPIFLEHENNASVRDGKWKLVGQKVSPKGGIDASKWELYDMQADGVELNDLASTYPGVVADLAAQWSEWSNRVQVYPK